MENQEAITHTDINIAAVRSEVSRYFDRCESYCYSELAPFPADIQTLCERLDWIALSIKHHVKINSFFDPAQAASLKAIELDDLSARSEVLFSLPVTWRDPSHALYGCLADLFYEDAVLENFFVKHQSLIRDRGFRALIKPEAVLSSALHDVIVRLKGDALGGIGPIIQNSIDLDRLAENFRLRRTIKVSAQLYEQDWLLR